MGRAQCTRANGETLRTLTINCTTSEGPQLKEALQNPATPPAPAPTPVPTTGATLTPLPAQLEPTPSPAAKPATQAVAPSGAVKGSDTIAGLRLEAAQLKRAGKTSEARMALSRAKQLDKVRKRPPSSDVRVCCRRQQGLRASTARSRVHTPIRAA